MAIAPIMTIFSWTYNRSNFDVALPELALGMLIVFGPVIIMLFLLMLTDKRRLHRAGFAFLIVHRIAMMIWLAASA